MKILLKALLMAFSLCQVKSGEPTLELHHLKADLRCAPALPVLTMRKRPLSLVVPDVKSLPRTGGHSSVVICPRTSPLGHTRLWHAYPPPSEIFQSISSIFVPEKAKIPASLAFLPLAVNYFSGKDRISILLTA